MQLQITKLCADSLRFFSHDNFGIQIKSSHAHELVAAYFGYSCRAALLADTKCPITNIRQAEFLILTPTASITERRKQLNGLPEDLPEDLAEGVYSPLINKKFILCKIWPTLEYLASALADESLKSKPYFFSDQKIQRHGVKVEPYGDGVYLKVSREYVSPTRIFSQQQGIRGVVDLFKLKRIAGNIGYIKVNHTSTNAETLDLAIKEMEIIQQPTSNVKQIEQFELSFTDWLKKQIGRHSPLGDLARDMADDETWPTLGTLDSYENYLLSRSADWRAVETLKRAWKTYNAFVKRKRSPNPVKKVTKPAVKKHDSRTIVFVKGVKPLHYSKRTIEKFVAGDKAWISWQGKKAIPVTVLEVDEMYYTFRIERPLKKAGDKHYVRLDEVRSTPELACINHITF
jgi:hypothetical protein